MHDEGRLKILLAICAVALSGCTTNHGLGMKATVAGHTVEAGAYAAIDQTQYWVGTNPNAPTVTVASASVPPKNYTPTQDIGRTGQKGK